MSSTFQSGEAGVCGTAEVDKLWGQVSEFARGSPAEWWATIQSVGISAIRRQYLHNDYFVGGLGLMIIGLLSRHLWKYCTLLYNNLRRSHGVYRVYVKTEDPAFAWLQEWLSDKAYKDSTQLILKVNWDAVSHEEDPITCVDSPLGPRPQLYYVPELLDVQVLEFQGEKVSASSNSIRIHVRSVDAIQDHRCFSPVTVPFHSLHKSKITSVKHAYLS